MTEAKGGTTWQFTRDEEVAIPGTGVKTAQTILQAQMWQLNTTGHRRIFAMSAKLKRKKEDVKNDGLREVP